MKSTPIMDDDYERFIKKLARTLKLYKILDITESLTGLSYGQYLTNILEKEDTLLISARRPNSDIVFKIHEDYEKMTETKVIIFYKRSYLLLKDTDLHNNMKHIVDFVNSNNSFMKDIKRNLKING